ncbi:hypothetical protein HW555_003688 [Spodoptera exigua]|uniref:Uncharacterized protein n=1 Tax=Spodoptera exigua TaxID=7107 RepID=A0A835GMC1_SPOEX|nr:hypothetical protein HW555_003688 [Spodoptera exigua]
MIRLASDNRVLGADVVKPKRGTKFLKEICQHSVGVLCWVEIVANSDLLSVYNRPIGSNLRLKNPVTFVRHALGPVTACQLLAPTRPAGVDWFPKWKGMRKQGLNPGGCLTCDPHCIICTTEYK